MLRIRACAQFQFAIDDNQRFWSNVAMTFGMGRIILLLGFVVSTLSQPASTRAVTIRDDQPDSSYLALAAETEYASVGLFVNSWGYTGSGILIAPDWVLTAAHNLILANSGTFTINGIPYASSSLFLNPGWQNNNPFGGYDFGLVHLAEPVQGVTPAVLYEGSSEIGQTAVFVGYGFTGTGLTGYQTLDNQKRAFQNVIDGDFGNPSLLLGSDFDNPSIPDNGFGESMPLPLEGSVAFGDSGGGVFITVGQQSYLAGVISFVAATDGNANGDYGDLSGFGRVSAFNSWILSTIPEPSSLTLTAVTGLTLIFTRRVANHSGGRSSSQGVP